MAAGAHAHRPPGSGEGSVSPRASEGGAACGQCHWLIFAEIDVAFCRISAGRANTTIRAMNTSSTARRPAFPASDASVIGLVGIAHLISHFSQLLLAPLFPWLKDRLERQLHRTRLPDDDLLRGVVRGAGASGFLVDRFGPRPILFGGLALVGSGGFRLFHQHQLLDDGRLLP
jgi:hypothetical protein